MKFLKKILLFCIVLIANFVLINAFAEDRLCFELFIKDHKFTPKILEVPAGKKLKITVYNQDPTVEEFESFDLKREKIVPAYAKINIILAPLKVGDYRFFGEFHEDTAQGILRVVNLSDFSPS
ncbi:cupredoxin domain-containing protein [Rickettsia endosymbiont of Cardiosporidium cionae]|uniref:cupredoxin domain-containing protein n=1 Tax=Rickettsia endosymbiont of Cardiosporidium cionae TaxID=2777155 RepID=UPI0018957F5A|nr:cupredoxin domain-containing protein [Rickettsia endosymbiont of Cardiosporidium cionae]KAF8818822.1 cupredoxin domain-containing protein [Rickettsia endosymbiont of Cardiosporidium cionae]